MGNKVDRDEIKDLIKQEVERQTKENLAQYNKASFDDYLEEQISREAKKLCIQGINTQNGVSKTTFHNFMKDDLKMSENDAKKVKLESIKTLPQVNNQKQKVMVTLKDVQGRNEVLKHRKNLQRGTYVNTQVPQIYVEKNKQFENMAKDLKLTGSYITRIDFQGPQLQLKAAHKPNDPNTKLSFQIIKEWTPPVQTPSQIRARKQGANPNNIPIGQIIPPPNVEIPKIVIKNVKNHTEDQVLNALLELNADIDPNSVGIQVSSTKDIFILTMGSLEQATGLVKKHNGRTILRQKVEMHMSYF